MCPGSITVKWRLLLWRTCFSFFHLFVSSERGRVYSQLCVRLSFRNSAFAFVLSRGNQGFEFPKNPSLPSILFWKKRRFLVQGAEIGEVISLPQIAAAISFLSFCLLAGCGGGRFVLTWSNILPSFCEIRTQAKGHASACLYWCPQTAV